MPRRPKGEPAPPADDDEDDLEPSGPPRVRGGRHRPPPVKPWSPSGADEEEEEREDDGRFHLLHRPKRPVFFRARDSLYFEPLVALAILILLLVSLWAYTQNWPPVYVVESQSMQHGTVDQLGLINTGDLILAQKVSSSDITTYIEGSQDHYSTYGEFGDVLLYHPDGTGVTPVIHRAIVYLQADPGGGTWTVPSLAGLPCGSAPNAVYSVSGAPMGSPPGCGSTGISGVLTLYGVGWSSVTVTLPLNSLGGTSGYVTMGDNNLVGPPGNQTGEPDQTFGISSIVQPGWIIGVARGMIPWVGSVKLLLEGNSAEVPTQSWEFLGLSVVALLLVAYGLHWLLRAEGIEDPRRKAADEEEEDDDEEEEEPPESEGRRRWLSPVRRWRSPKEDGEGASEAPEDARGHGGRPRPMIGRRGREPRRGKKARADADEDL
jgi:signal peptidase